MTSERSPEQTFFDRLSRLDRGDLAELRRSLGEGGHAYFVEREIVQAGVQQFNRNVLYLIAGLYALIERPHDETDVEDAAPTSRKGVSLGKLLGQLYRVQDERPSTEKRFLALLDADEEALPYHLRQVVTLLKSSDLKPDWAQLLKDVSFWNHERWGEEVRRRWANDFYRTATTTDSDSTTDSQEEDR